MRIGTVELEGQAVESEGTQMSSLYEDGEREAQRFKWIESERVGHDTLFQYSCP